MVVRKAGISASNSQQLSQSHYRSTPEQDYAATESINRPEAWNRHNDVDHIDDNVDDERIFNTRVHEKAGAIVENLQCGKSSIIRQMLTKLMPHSCWSALSPPEVKVRRRI